MGKIFGKFRVLESAVELEVREHKGSFAVFVTLRILVVAVLVVSLITRQYENVFLCLLSLLLFLAPSVLQLTLRVEIPETLEVIFLLFIFAAEILGEINEFYIKFPYWDTMLHTLNGFLAAAIGYSMVTLLNRSEKTTFNLSPFYLSMVAFCFSMTIGVIWEFFEFSMDFFLGFDMQKDTVINSFNSILLNPDGKNVPVSTGLIESTSINGKPLPVDGYIDIGLIDTMADLFVNFIGALVFSIIGYRYAKSKGSKKIAESLIPTVKAEDADYLTQMMEKAKAKYPETEQNIHTNIIHELREKGKKDGQFTDKDN